MHRLWLSLWWCSLSHYQQTTAFLPHHRLGGWTTRQQQQQKSTQLFYQNNSTDDSTSSTSSFVEIPVIGQLMNNPSPLLMGGTMWLTSPTPLQWKTIEVCVEQHYQQQQQQQLRTNNNETMHATVDAAPLVAILNVDTQYATIAAIMGVVSESQTIDTRDPISFRESLSGFLQTPMYRDSSRIRLLGIGRATLTGFFNRKEEEERRKENEDTSETTTTTTGEASSSSSSSSNNENQEVYDDSVYEPVLMAQMKLVMDGCFVKNQEFGSQSSPVHALSQLSIWASRLGFLHADRQKLVQGLQAAQARIEMASQDWQDWDGIGTLFEEAETVGAKGDGDDTNINTTLLQSQIDEMLQSFSGAQTQPLSPKAARLAELDNYGLGTVPSAYSGLHALTKVLKEALQPYYSPELVESEEFEYGVLSWVALRSLQAYLETADLIQAMESTNTCERLEGLYEAMLQHKGVLQELAQAKSQELRDCGEECTDLW